MNFGCDPTNEFGDNAGGGHGEALYLAILILQRIPHPIASSATLLWDGHFFQGRRILPQSLNYL